MLFLWQHNLDGAAAHCMSKLKQTSQDEPHDTELVT